MGGFSLDDVGLDRPGERVARKAHAVHHPDADPGTGEPLEDAYPGLCLGCGGAVHPCVGQVACLPVSRADSALSMWVSIGLANASRARPMPFTIQTPIQVRVNRSKMHTRACV